CSWSERVLVPQRASRARRSCSAAGPRARSARWWVRHALRFWARRRRRSEARQRSSMTLAYAADAALLGSSLAERLRYSAVSSCSRSSRSCSPQRVRRSHCPTFAPINSRMAAGRLSLLFTGRSPRTPARRAKAWLGCWRRRSMTPASRYLDQSRPQPPLLAPVRGRRDGLKQPQVDGITPAFRQRQEEDGL